VRAAPVALALLLGILGTLSVTPAMAEAPARSPRPEARAMPEPAIRPVARPLPVRAAPQELRAERLMAATRSTDAIPVEVGRAQSLPLLAPPVDPDPRAVLPGMTTPRPVARPVAAPVDRVGPEAGAEARMPQISPFAVPLSLHPQDRPATIEATARRIDEERARGAICDDLDIQGDRIGAHPGPGSCGVDAAVRVRAVAGVRLSTPAVMDCATARALKTWVEHGLRPAVGTAGGGAEAIRVMGHYSCRPRNNQPGARLSEHAFGRAIDVGGIRLRDGTEISVLRDWNGSAHGARLRQMWQAACGPFGTVLGPNANAAHRDHFHFDTARYRSGSYCR